MDRERREEVLHHAAQARAEKDAALVRAVFASSAYVTELGEDKNTTIRRLRPLFFGSRTEKTEAVVGPKPGTSEDTASPDAAVEIEPAAGEGTAGDSETAAVSKGHGRNGAEAYRGAKRVNGAPSTRRAGDACPACGEGTVSEKAPGVLVQIPGQPPWAATVDPLQKLRGHLGGQVFTAATPEEAGPKKYDATAGRRIGRLKYGSGRPFNRRDGQQGDLGVPLPASTQWDLVEAVAGILAPVLDELIRQAAQGQVLHHDDTTVKSRERERGRSPEARLLFPQEASGPTREPRRDWLERQRGEKRTEPNSALGGAIGSPLKPGEALTLFLRQAGAPRDNTLGERALKKAILHRNNALFSKTQNDARVGDLVRSLISTCQLNEANPFDDLTELQRHADRLAVRPPP